MKYYYAPAVVGGNLVLLGKESGGQVIPALPHTLTGVYSPLYDGQIMVVFAVDVFVALDGWVEKTKDEVFSDYPELFSSASGISSGVVQVGDGESPYQALGAEDKTSIYEVSSVSPFNFVLPSVSDGMIVIIKVGALCGPQNPVTISAYGQEQIDSLPSYLMTHPRSAITCASNGVGWIIV